MSAMQTIDTLDARIPRAPECERATLGCILISGNGAIARAAQIVEPGDFLQPHKSIFRALVDMNARGIPTDDVILLQRELQDRGELEIVGGPAYLASLVDGVPHSAHVEFYARQVKEASESRARIESAAQTIASEVLPEPTPADHHLTDVGNAERLIAAHGSDLLCVNARKPWIAWDGTRWRWDDRGEVLRRARATVKAMFLEAADLEGKERDTLWAHARKSESAHALDAMISIARCDVPVQLDALDADPFMLNVPNGTIDLRTGTLRPHRRSDMITKIAGATYDGEATCPKWTAFLDRIMAGNADLIGFLQRAVGYSLTGDTSEQVIFILYGTGANGKSTFLRLLADALGDYAQQAPVRALLNGRNDEHPTAIAGLRGARLVSAVEVEEGRRIAESLVKQLTGCDRVAARLMRKDYFEFLPTFKIVLAVNHRPEIRGTDLAIWRRIRLVPFDVTIPPAEQDRHLADALRAELPGILAWAVRGCIAWQRDGLGAPEAVTAATETYRAESDVLAAFLETETVQGPDYSVSKTELYSAFTRWAGANGEQPMTHKALSLRLTERGFTDWRGTGGRRFWRGVGLPAKQQE